MWWCHCVCVRVRLCVEQIAEEEEVWPHRGKKRSGLVEVKSWPIFPGDVPDSLLVESVRGSRSRPEKNSVAPRSSGEEEESGSPTA